MRRGPGRYFFISFLITLSPTNNCALYIANTEAKKCAASLTYFFLWYLFAFGGCAMNMGDCKSWQSSPLSSLLLWCLMGGGGLFDFMDCFFFHFVLVLITICKSYFQLLLFLLLSFTLLSLISLFLLFYNLQIHQSTRLSVVVAAA